MDPELIDKVCWTNRDSIRKPIRLMHIRLSGLGWQEMKNGPDQFEAECADAGILTVVPYHDPWSWMNDRTVGFVDELRRAITDSLRLKDPIRTIVSGFSMGGFAALLYACKTDLPVISCAAICPVTDLEFHYGERPDLPRTLHAAYDSYKDIRKILRGRSPVNLAETMPDIPYLVIHGIEDRAVGIARHSDRFIREMRKAGKEIEYIREKGMAHCHPFTWKTWRKYADFILRPD